VSTTQIPVPTERGADLRRVAHGGALNLAGAAVVTIWYRPAEFSRTAYSSLFVQ